jgi:hypothetical protein
MLLGKDLKNRGVLCFDGKERLKSKFTDSQLLAIFREGADGLVLAEML